ncbi:sensor histidine kinase [Desulfomonile tiedjei]|uniref:histidine kinase n=1 Tax=Desulfomonile tiedjei (strain ATCC 49306 / DSM 6799 / DCB-1) TaxID=706587 RepID=I4C6W9_DESTA|nr:ATP-binding protein [Desulfomonile tiedjei]AFM25310.1 bacteriophytochrome (light-regulated signal transduction histidine kinase) [Desulfomonile tiedjei DSM 6799]
MTTKTIFPGQANYLDAFIKTAQYLARLTIHQDVWSETSKLLVNFWGADLGGFGDRRSNGEIAVCHWTFSTELRERMDLAAEVNEEIAEVLDSGFLSWRFVSSTPEPLVIAFLPISLENQVTRVLLVGHRSSGLFPKDLLNIYLALAGLVGTTAERLASEAELRKHRQHLEELVRERTARLTKANEQLQSEIIHRHRAEEALQKAHDELEVRVQKRTAELENAKEAVATERQKLFDILETMPVMVCLLKPDYQVAFANRGSREKFGEDRGRRCFDYRFGRKEPCEFCESFNVLKTGEPHHWEFIGPEGSIMDAYDFPFVDTDGSVLVLEVNIDITERKRVEDALKQTLAELSRSNEDLQQFAYVASHDLQEPLRTVASALQLFEKKHRGKFDKDSDQLIDFAVDGARRMRALIQDLLAYSRLNTRGQAFGPVDMKEVLNQSIKNLRSLIEEKGAEITCNHMPILMGDPIQLIQLLQNLIGNALKFGPAISPKVHVSAQQNGNEWIFSVKDNGIGIQQKYFERIFVIFQQLSKKGPFHGTGIGLAVVKKIVERHHGRVWVESEVGTGSTFYFTIPDRMER